MLAADVDDVARQLDSRLQSFPGDNVIRMPLTPEVENSPPRNFYVFSPQLHSLVAHMRNFFRNGISCAYLLGGHVFGRRMPHPQLREPTTARGGHLLS